jgi:hypothetical protein
MAVTGIHALLYTSEPDELRRVLGEVFQWTSVDAGGGWLIFRLPPAELGVHPAGAPAHALSMMCDDLAATMGELQPSGIRFKGEPHAEGFGVATTMVLPGGVEMMLYEPRHPTAV